MIGVAFATDQEAEPFLNVVASRKIADEPFQVHQFSLADGGQKGVAIISGMGKVSAALATQHLILVHHVTEVVNAGICGAVADGMSVGEVLRVDECREGDVERPDGGAKAYPTGRDRWRELPSARLVTMDRPVNTRELREHAARWGQIADMEGAAVVRTGAVHGIEVHLVKVVTDLADRASREEIKKNIRGASETLARILRDGLSEEPSPSGGAVDRAMLADGAEKSRPAGLSHRGLRGTLSFIRIEHTIFSLPLLFAGAWLGAGRRFPSWRVILLIVLAGVGARILGMAMNRILDRDLDARNPRTRNRELPAGRVSLAGAYAVAASGLGMYMLACVLLGPTCALLSPVPAVVLILYSLLKRFTSLCHFGIGLCLAMAPLGAFVAARSGPEFSIELDLDVILLAIFTFCWISAFDVIYALQDLESDRITGVKSLPARLGPGGAQVVAALVHVIGLAAIAALILVSHGSLFAWLSLLVTVGAIALAYVRWIPLAARFFPLSAIAGIAGALVAFFGARP